MDHAWYGQLFKSFEAKVSLGLRATSAPPAPLHVFVPSRGHLGSRRFDIGPILDLPRGTFGASWGHLGAILGILGVSLGVLGVGLGAIGGSVAAKLKF